MTVNLIYRDIVGRGSVQVLMSASVRNPASNSIGDDGPVPTGIDARLTGSTL